MSPSYAEMTTLLLSEHEMRKLTVFLITAAVFAGCTSHKSADKASEESATAQQAAAESPAMPSNDGEFAEPRFGTAVEPGSDMWPGPNNYRKAVFAGGCFWCMEKPFDKIDGVVATVSGYIGGKEREPTYRQVGAHKTGHTEGVLIIYDHDKVTFEKLVDKFWRTHDPTDAGGQFVDRGATYRPGIFVYDATQRQIAEKSRDAMDASGRFDKPIAIEITDATTFWPAEDYHQDFYKKDPNHYNRYRRGSGRDQFLERIWKDELEH